MARKVFLVVDAGGVVGVFSNEKMARTSIRKLGKMPGWGGAMFPWNAPSLSKSDTAVHFLFPMGGVTFPIAIGTKEAMVEQCAKLARIGITAEGDSDYYQGTIDQILPSAADRILPATMRKLGAKALDAFTKMVAPTSGSGAPAEPELTIAELIDHASPEAIVPVCEDGPSEAEPSEIEPTEAEPSESEPSEGFVKVDAPSEDAPSEEASVTVEAASSSTTE